MSLQDRKIDEFIDSKLRQSRLESTSPGFTQFVMKRANSEYKSLAAEEKHDRVAKYIIGIFSALMVGFTVFMGYIAKSELSSTVRSTGVSIEPTVQTSNNFIQNFLAYIQSFFVNLLALLGFSATPQSVIIIVGLVLVLAFYLLADRIFLKGKLKSIRS